MISNVQQKRRDRQAERAPVEADALGEQQRGLRERQGVYGQVLAALLHGDHQQHQRQIEPDAGQGDDHRDRRNGGAFAQSLDDAVHMMWRSSRISRMNVAA